MSHSATRLLGRLAQDELADGDEERHEGDEREEHAVGDGRRVLASRRVGVHLRRARGSAGQPGYERAHPRIIVNRDRLRFLQSSSVSPGCRTRISTSGATAAAASTKRSGGWRRNEGTARRPR